MTADTVSFTDDDMAALRLAGQFWASPGAKEMAIRERFGVSATRFYQRVNRLLDNPEALAADPLLVNRLRRIAGTRAARRQSGAEMRARRTR